MPNAIFMSCTFLFYDASVDFSPFYCLKIFTGNTNSEAVVYNSVRPPITTRFIRLIPVEWHNHISMRIEIYGCPGALKKKLELIIL